MKSAEPQRAEDRRRVVELLLSALAVVGTLTGVWLGYRGTIHSVDVQLEHEDRTRYQEQRLDTYTAFLDTATTLVSMGDNPRPLSPPQTEIFAERLLTLHTTFNRLLLAAGPDVRRLGGELHALVLPFARGEYKTPEAGAAAQKKYMAKLSELLGAMRRELGTELRQAD